MSSACALCVTYSKLNYPTFGHGQGKSRSARWSWIYVIFPFWPFLTGTIKWSLAQSGSFPVELQHSRESRSAWANHKSAQTRVPLCLQGCDSSMWVRASPRATSPQGPLLDGYNSSPRVDAIAGIPTRNQDAFVQGTDTLAAASQSIHHSLKGVAIAKGHSSRPTARLRKGQGHRGRHGRRHRGGAVKLPDGRHRGIIRLLLELLFLTSQEGRPPENVTE